MVGPLWFLLPIILAGMTFTVDRAAAAPECGPPFYHCSAGTFCTSQNMGDNATSGICCPAGHEPTLVGFRTIGGFPNQPIWECRRPSNKPKPNPCSKGQKLVNGKCEPAGGKKPLSPCPAGEERVGSQCLPKCPKGTTRRANQCVPNPQPIQPDLNCWAQGGVMGKDAKTGKTFCDTTSTCRPWGYACKHVDNRIGTTCCNPGQVCDAGKMGDTKNWGCK